MNPPAARASVVVSSLALPFLLASLLSCGSTPVPLASVPPLEEHDPNDDITSDETNAQPVSVADDSFPGLYAETAGFRAGRPAAMSFTPDGNHLLFLRSEARNGQRSLYTLDVATREESVLLTAEQVLQGDSEELSAEERALRERLRMTASGITSYKLSPDGSQVLVPLSGHLYIVTLETREVRELASDGGYANDPRFAPDGRHVACVRNGELYVIDVASGRQRRVTRRRGEHVVTGLAEFVAQEEMSRYHGYWWSPDSRSIVYQETDTEGVETLYAGNPINPSSEPHGSPYPRAGTANAKVRLGVVSRNGGRTRWIDWDSEQYPYLASVKWRAETPLALVVQDRAQQNAAVLTVDPRTGRTTTVHEEHDDAWLNIDQTVPRFLDAERFLWSTERNGRWQLEVRTVGGDARYVSAAELGYERILRVDADNVWISSAPAPGENQLVRITLGESDATSTVVSEARGMHSATFGANGLWVHEHHPEAGQATWTLKRNEETLGPVRSVAEAFPFDVNIEFHEVGEERFRAAVVRPRNFVEGRKYPVLVSVYGGPGYVKVRRQSERWLREQWQADHGFIVVSVDGRGTPGRGREWERAIRGNVIDGPLNDQVAGVQALAALVPEMDIDRVGIYGWSFGGYFSAMAVARRPDIFKVGVAGAPVCDWQDYDTHYTERFMGLPSENEEGYRVSSVLTYTDELRRPLMIIHGTSDDNVYFVHALKMSDALLRSGAAHEFVVLAGSTHMVADPNVASALQSRVMRFLSAGLRDAP
ncbi:MAG: DPP IV N-terminal domain-containing protein [Polyangiales bacterium]